VRRLLVMISLIMVFCMGAASAEGMISASVQVRASRNVYDSVIRAGEDVDMTVDIVGFEPAACQWYFGDAPVDGANAKVMHIDSAEVSDTGMYRLDALDENGRVRLSVDVALRVVDREIPQTGDARLPHGVLVAVIAAAFLVLTAAVRCKVAKIQQKHT